MSRVGTSKTNPVKSLGWAEEKIIDKDYTVLNNCHPREAREKTQITYFSGKR